MEDRKGKTSLRKTKITEHYFAWRNLRVASMILVINWRIVRREEDKEEEDDDQDEDDKGKDKMEEEK